MSTTAVLEIPSVLDPPSQHYKTLLLGNSDPGPAAILIQLLIASFASTDDKKMPTQYGSMIISKAVSTAPLNPHLN